MFGTDQAALVDGLRSVGDLFCQYGPTIRQGGMWPRFCDCKYGATFQGEQSGCPEIAMAFHMIQAMTPKEFTRIRKRAMILIPEEDWK